MTEDIVIASTHIKFNNLNEMDKLLERNNSRCHLRRT